MAIKVVQIHLDDPTLRVDPGAGWIEYRAWVGTGSDSPEVLLSLDQASGGGNVSWVKWVLGTARDYGGENGVFIRVQFERGQDPSASDATHIIVNLYQANMIRNDPPILYAGAI
jgi:hypothetical protein